uniref:DRBM domain-containing protein n=1 Tax=Quercus lobata TaxID=97700 RepID=A0A7N2MX72_QUELO
MAEMRPNAFPQPRLEPEPQLSAPLQPQQRPSTSAAPSSSSRLPEQLMYKNRLQEYAQRSAIQLPMYKTVNEGSQHAPKFRSTVVVDGQIYTSPNTFLQRKIAEQDVSKLALEHISKKIKDERYPLTPLICENTVFCKSILNEFAVKMTLQKPVYNTVQTEGLPPVFISSLIFNGVCYNGEPGRNKKEAEQLAARAVILSHLGQSGSGIILSEIIKSKGKLYAALHKVKDRSHANISAVPQGPSIRAMEVAIPGASSRTQVRTELKVPPPEPSTQLISAQPSSQAVNLQSGFVLADLPEPSVVGPSSSKKRQKNQKEADKKLQYDAQRVLDIIEAGRHISLSPFHTFLQHKAI